MAYKLLTIDPQTPPRVKALIQSVENHFFRDVHTMLRLPMPEHELPAGCNFAITQVLAAAVSGISVTLYSDKGGAGARFKGLLRDFYPWSLEPGNAVKPDAGGVSPEYMEFWQRVELRPGRGSVGGRVALERRTVHILDALADPEFQQIEAQGITGARTYLGIPMLREDMFIGAIVMWRTEARAFTDKQIDLVKTFDDQAVIAIENVRLFNELAEKSRQLEVASQHKSEFLANMSHELRTPLNAVIGFPEVLIERMFGELSEKQDEYVRDIHASGAHLLSLINDILDLSKVEAGRMELELADFHLPQAIENALVLVRERALHRGITLEQSIDSRLGEMQGDERKIKQVLLNLLSNAIKFTPEGGRVGVRAEPVDEHVEVAVSDTGIGIAPEDQEAVFEEFRQVGTAEKKAEGTGLGLALARKFIELHGGRIWVRSQIGAGSTFTFTIPTRI
jgi:signal transduction histidine kinase